MDPSDLDADQLAQLADRIGPHLDPGQYGDRVVLTRRQLMGLATGTLGTGALLSLGVDDAAAQAAGSVGTSSDPVDVFGYDVDVANSLAMNGNAIQNAGSVSTELVGKERHYAGSYDGSDPDTRLDNTISAASDGDLIYLENDIYDVDRTISKALVLVGTDPGFRGTEIESTWTLSENIQLEKVSLSGTTSAEVIFDNSGGLFHDGYIGTEAQVAINADSVGVTSCWGAGSIVFSSGTSDGLADACFGGISATDNGTNTIGDVV